MSSSKNSFIRFSFERLDNLGVVQITLSGVLCFLPKCASKGEVSVFFEGQDIYRIWCTIGFDACFMWSELVVYSLIQASLFLIASISPSNSSID